MKKVVKLLLLVITCLFVFSLTSCAKGSFKEVELVKVEGILNQDTIVLDRPEEGKTFVGYFTFDEESKTGTLYLVGAIIPEGEYEPVYVDNKDLIKDEKDGSTYYSVPEHGHQRDGYYFAGWYQTEDFVFGQRVSLSKDVDKNVEKDHMDKIICAKYIDLADAGIIAIVCIAIVFLMLILLCLIVKGFKFIPQKKEAKPEPVAKPQPVVSAPQKAFTMADIKDEDMMVAALVATIDYHNETNEDVRVVSVKQIG